MAKLSPMMQQYFDLKEQHQDEILFFRLGDFYEMFYDDAILASQELELTLTGRDCGQEERAPMCGVPFHSSESYIARLIAKGYKVAICEQVEDPATAKGLVKRDIIRVVTPGTVIESSMLKDDRNNYLASIALKDGEAGVCFADVSTGEAQVTLLEGDKLELQIVSELCRFSPSEVLVSPEVMDLKEVASYIKHRMQCAVELMEEEHYEPQHVEQVMQQQFGEAYTLQTQLSCEELPCAALSVLLEYLAQTQKKGVERLKTVRHYAERQFMQLSPVTRANLELTETMRGREKKGTLLWVLDKTGTSMGKRMLRRWIEQPLVSAKAINDRLQAVEQLVQDTMGRADAMEAFRHIFDMERLMTRTVYGSATPKEIYSLAVTCQQLPTVKQLAESYQGQEMQRIAAELDTLQDIQQSILAALDETAPSTMKDGNVIRAGYNAEVDELREIMQGGKGYLAALEAKLKEEAGIRTLKVGYNRVFGYYIEVSKSFTSQVPDSFVRKQTLANAERYITDELKQLEGKILGASDRLATLEKELFDQLLQSISEHLLRIQQTAAAIARFDVLCAFAETAAQNHYVRPTVDESDTLCIRQGRHPVIERILSDSLFVPNDTTMDCDENRMLIITGPNMAGKSTYMRQNALIVLMAQIGSFVPAQSCHVGVVDAIFTRVGASDDLAAGQSTFMVEMTEVAEILQYASAKSLVILDEIGRGTSTFDGMSIARAVVEYMADKSGSLGCKTLFATHYHELTDLENTLQGVKNYSIAVKKRGDDITFLRRIVAGAADDSYGIQVAKLAGLPDAVTERAKEVLHQLESAMPDPSANVQMDFGVMQPMVENVVPQQAIETLKNTDVETLTPLEALNLLYKLKKMV